MPRTEASFQQIRDQRKGQILRTAAKVFREKGFANTKIWDLAEAAGISQGLLYRYYASKDQVLAALLVEATETAISLAESAVERPGGPWEGLHWLTEQLLNVMQTQPDLSYCFSQVSAIPGILRDPGARLDAALRRLMGAIIGAGDASHQDADEMVLLYLCCIQGIAAGTMVYGDRMIEHFPKAEIILRMFKQDV